MKHKHYITPYMVFATLIILVLGLTACGSGPKNNTPGKITGQAIKGPISGGTVTAYAVASGSKGSVLGTAQTDANGNYSISSGSYSGPVFLEITGGYYTDEATGTLVNLPTTAGSGLQAVVDNVSAGSTVQSQITPLTTMAVARAQNMPGGLTASNINASNQSIGTYFGGIDILNTQPINPLVSGSASGASQSAINYGLILAGLSQQVETLGLSNPFSLFTALAQDISDGTFDGKSGSTAVNLGGSPMDPTTGTSFLATAINTFSHDTTINASGGTVSETLITALQNAGDMPSDQGGSINLSWTSVSGADICTDYGITTINVKVVTSSGAEVSAGNWSCSAHEGTITDVPAGADYTIRITGTATGGAIAWRGEKSGVSVIAGETTTAGTITMVYIGSDITPPVITSTTPLIDATGVPVTTMITGIFSEKMAASPIDTTTFTLKQGAIPVSGSVVYDANAQRSIFIPLNNLSYSTTYTATITKDVEDMAGNNMESDFSWSFTTEDQPTTSPSAPTGIIAASGNSQNTITWDAVPAATSYNIYWSTTSGVTTATGAKISDITTTSYTHTGLTNGTTYYYIVTSTNSYGESVESYEVSSAPGSIDTSPPTGSITINNNAVYTTSTDVTLSLSSSSTRGVSQMCISNTTTCSSWEPYTTSKSWILTTGDGLRFVYAWFKDSAGTSNTSPYLAAITLDTTPPTDGTLTATAGDGQVLLSWSGFSDVTSGIGSYRLVYSTSGTPDSCLSGTNIYSGSETSYTHTGLTNGTIYYYRVCATDNAENASIGSMATFTPGYWVRQIGSVKKDVSRGIAVDADGNSYITGYTEGYLFGVGIEKGYDMFLVKFDANGSFDVIKEGFYDAKGENDFGMDIDVNSDSPSLVISGYKEDSEGDLWAMTEYNLPGSVVPFPYPSGGATFSIGVGYSVALDPHGGGYHSTGSIYEDMVTDYQVYFGGKDIYINKQHFPGYFSRRIGTALDDEGYGIAVDSGGNSYTTGYTEGDLAGNGHLGGQDIFVVKYDTDGILRWIRQIGTTLDDVGYGIAVDSEGNSYIAGHTEGNLAGSGHDGGQDIFVAKYDTNGTQKWIRQIGTAFDDVGYDIAVDSEGNSYVTGSTGGDLSGSGHAGGQDIFVVKYDTNGTLQSMRQIGTAFDDVSYAIALDLNGTSHITGYTDGDLDGKGNIGESDIFIMRFYGM